MDEKLRLLVRDYWHLRALDNTGVHLADPMLTDDTLDAPPPEIRTYEAVCRHIAKMVPAVNPTDDEYCQDCLEPFIYKPKFDLVVPNPKYL